MALPLAALIAGEASTIAGSEALRFFAAKSAFNLGDDVLNKAMLPRMDKLSVSGGTDFSPHLGTLSRPDSAPGLFSNFDIGRLWGKADVLKELANAAQQGLSEIAMDGLQHTPGIGETVKVCRTLTDLSETFGRAKNISGLLNKLGAIDLKALDLPVAGNVGQILHETKNKVSELIDEITRLTGAGQASHSQHPNDYSM